MARIAGVVLLGYPHHLMQRGVRSTPVSCSDEDRHKTYSYWMSEAAVKNVNVKTNPHRLMCSEGRTFSRQAFSAYIVTQHEVKDV